MVLIHIEQNQAIVSRTTVSLLKIVGTMLLYSAYISADKYNDALAQFDQTVSVNGVKISTLSTSTTS
jgi:hypothetical protein